MHFDRTAIGKPTIDNDIQEAQVRQARETANAIFKPKQPVAEPETTNPMNSRTAREPRILTTKGTA